MLPDLKTRHSLINRLRRPENQEGWQVFFDTYWRLIYGTAIKAGLSDHEAEEAVQETVITVSRTIANFKYDPDRCSFKGWLLRITRFKIIDQFRKRKRHGWMTRPPRGPGTTVMERLPDPDSLDLDGIWESEWKQNLMEVAMERVKARVNQQHFQIFHLTAVKERSPKDVARALKINIARVYLAKSRIAALVRKEVEQLEKGEDTG